MSRAPDWTLAEFEALTAHNELSDDDLATLLRTREPGAVEVVRNGIHAYHRGQNVSMLSQMMLRRLGDETNVVRCPRCGEAVR